MGNIYIETDENFRVTKVHRMPFDPNNGMGYSREELEKKGFFVEEIPEAVQQTGRRSIMMYNPDTKGIYYEYANIPLSDKERVDQMENAFNYFLMRNAIYGAGYYATATMSLDEETQPKQPELEAGEIQLGQYLAHQIIAGKITMEQCNITFPQLEEVIKDTLKDNGIQL